MTEEKRGSISVFIWFRMHLMVRHHLLILAPQARPNRSKKVWRYPGKSVEIYFGENRVDVKVWK